MVVEKKKRRIKLREFIGSKNNHEKDIIYKDVN